MSSQKLKETAELDTNLVWIDLEMTGLDTTADHIIEVANDCHGQKSERNRGWARAGRPSISECAGSYGRLEHPPTWRVGSYRTCVGKQIFNGRSRAANAGVFAAVCCRRRITHVWQQHLPGQAISGAPNAGIRSFFSLPESGCQHAENARTTLGTGGRSRLQQIVFA